MARHSNPVPPSATASLSQRPTLSITHSGWHWTASGERGRVLATALNSGHPRPAPAGCGACPRPEPPTPLRGKDAGQARWMIIYLAGPVRVPSHRAAAVPASRCRHSVLYGLYGCFADRAINRLTGLSLSATRPVVLWPTVVAEVEAHSLRETKTTVTTIYTFLLRLAIRHTGWTFGAAI